LSLSILPIGLYAAILLLAIGVVYQYGIKRSKPDIGYIVQLIVYSAIVGNGFIWMIKGFTFAIFGSSKLGDISSADIRGLVFIGSLCGMAMIGYFFLKFLRRKDQDKNG
jgi:hypothetical protein